jgi:hypothetical protein
LDTIPKLALDYYILLRVRTGLGLEARKPLILRCLLEPPLGEAFAQEVYMFARHVSMILKANSVAEFTRTIENEIIPLLRKQKGFKDEITLVVAGGREAVGISLWDQKENAEAYNRTTYPQVLELLLARVVEGTPEVKTYEVANSTFHKIAARAAAGG